MEATEGRWNLQATYTVELDVENAPTTWAPWGSNRPIQPHTVRISYEFPESFSGPRAQVYGCNILKDGTLGAERDIRFYAIQTLWPGWLLELTEKHAPNWNEIFTKGVPK